MNQKTFGTTIMNLRKKKGLTQAALAKSLNVGDKAVSKWENGLGYPEITLLPKLASTLGVSLDYLMTGERSGIAIAGNILTDLVKNVDCWPQVGMLANISSISRAVGGCTPNTSINLAKIDSDIPVFAIGCVGDDEHGHYVISQLQKNGIDTSGVTVMEEQSTGFSDVINLPTGERTFFHARGVNSLFSPEHVNLSSLRCRILHIGYIFLLDSFDAPDAEYGTVMAKFLHNVQNLGIKTSIDVVSDSLADYPSMIIPALKYCDYVIINEIECCSIWGYDPRHADNSLNIPLLKKAMEQTFACGINDKLIVHSKEASFCLNHTGQFTMVPSLKIPSEDVKGSVGAGDAFCAGCLHSIYNNYTDNQILEFASAAAACNLFAENAVDGMRNKIAIQKMMDTYPRRELSYAGHIE